MPAARPRAPRQLDERAQQQRRAKAQHKLSLTRGSRGGAGPDEKEALSGKVKYTPLEAQVVAIKKANPGVVLFVEVGYKFRLFGDDARLAAQQLNIYCFPDHNFMTASIPVPRLHVYVRRLVKKGHKVGVVRQNETSALKAAGATKNSVFQRKLTAVYTPSTLEVGTSEDVGVEAAGGVGAEDGAELSSYLMSVWEESPKRAGDAAAEEGDMRRGDVCFAAMDPSTSDIVWGVCADYVTQNTLESALMYVAPKEMVVLGQLSRPAARLVKTFMAKADAANTEEVADRPLSAERLLAGVQELYGPRKREDDAFLEALEKVPPGVLRTLRALFEYLKSFGLLVWNENGATLRPITEPGHMQLTGNAMTQLHVTETEQGSHVGSLLHLVDCTVSRLGARLLRRLVSKPLVCMEAITERQDAVAELCAPGGAALLQTLQGALRKMPDLERAISRMFHGRANPAEFVLVMKTLQDLPDQLRTGCGRDAVGDIASAPLLASCVGTACAPLVVSAAERFLSYLDDAAAAEGELNAVFRSEERFPDVFERRRALQAAVDDLQALLPVLARQAGVGTLAYVDIQNQGDHLIELPVDARAPSGWTKVCSTKKFHRYHPPEVKRALSQKDIASELLTAECKRSWAALLDEFAPYCCSFRGAAAAVATLDCLQSLASVAQRPGYCRPEFVDDSSPARITVRGGRAPVLDAQLAGGAVPNDVDLREDGLRALCINGPNMAGKSCYMRQVAQTVLLAQIGSWVPAESVQLRVVDAILTRMGASDNILQGRSTFLEELLDASEMLKRATPSSLLILDELGRGTATHDGVAIAVATLEHVVRVTRSMTLFVTHYPEVCEAAEALAPAAACFHMAHLRQGCWDFGAAAAQAAASVNGSEGARQEGTAASGHLLGDCTNLAPGGLRTESAADDSAAIVAKRGAVTDHGGVLAAVPLSGEGAAPPAAELPAAVRGRGGGGVAAVAGGAQGAGASEVPKIVFLYKLQPGAADQSFGLNVAMLAGLPPSVVQRAAVVAAEMADKAASVGVEPGREAPTGAPGSLDASAGGAGDSSLTEQSGLLQRDDALQLALRVDSCLTSNLGDAAMCSKLRELAGQALQLVHA